jgi:hypothetical protein
VCLASFPSLFSANFGSWWRLNVVHKIIQAQIYSSRRGINTVKANWRTTNDLCEETHSMDDILLHNITQHPISSATDNHGHWKLTRLACVFSAIFLSFFSSGSWWRSNGVHKFIQAQIDSSRRGINTVKANWRRTNDICEETH